MSKERSIAVARQFAGLMDHDRFEDAAAFLASDCRYEIRGQTLIGAEAIMRAYRNNSAKGRELLDELRYESTVEGMQGEDVGVLYVDHLRKGRHSHIHRCRQLMRIADGKIVAIKHVDLDGEAEGLRNFFKSAGVRWEQEKEGDTHQPKEM